MKKLKNKIKKVFSIIGIFLISMTTKVVALVPQPMYGVSKPEDSYKVSNVSSSSITMFWKIARNFVIPIVFLIGAIIYFKKSGGSTIRKIITILIVLALIVLVCFGLNYIVTKM